MSVWQERAECASAPHGWRTAERNGRRSSGAVLASLWMHWNLSRLSRRLFWYLIFGSNVSVWERSSIDVLCVNLEHKSREDWQTRERERAHSYRLCGTIMFTFTMYAVSCERL